MISGLEEDSNKSASESTKEFIESILGLKKINIKEAYRIGSPPKEGSTYCRPIIVKFFNITHRNKVWRKRHNIKNEKEGNTVRIQADLPKKLREDLRTLYRIVKAASQMPEYRSAVIRDYAIHLQGQEYSPNQLEELPTPLRPSTLAVHTSENAMVFFSKHSFLSNHYPAQFHLQDLKFETVEQFLAYKRAQTSGQNSLVQKALSAQNPTDAKSILNSLKEDHPEEWADNRAEWAKEALRAKFTQNKTIADKLCATANLQLGEASQNAVWGIGLDLEDENVLNINQWSQNGNLLGRLLMDVRREIMATREEQRK